MATGATLYMHMFITPVKSRLQQHATWSRLLVSSATVTLLRLRCRNDDDGNGCEGHSWCFVDPCVAAVAGQVLMDELGYAADEVDDMDPQIAAVVIEKSLPRPRAGEST